MPRNLIDTVAHVLELSGAVVEKDSDRLAALLPAETANRLGLPEEAGFYVDPQKPVPGSELLTLQSEFVDRLFGLMGEKGVYAEIATGDLHLKTGARAAAESRFSARNGLARALDAIETRAVYACWNFKYTALSDEKKEGLVRTVVNEHTLSAAPEILSQLELSTYNEGMRYTGLPIQPFARIYATSCHQAEHQIRQELVEFQRSLQRRLQRDVGRLTDYYQSLIAEIRKKIERRGLEGKEREDQEARIRATELELERKIWDQRSKYAMKIEVTPISLLRINVPVVVVNLALQFRKLTRELPLVWNPLLRDFEGLPCQGCAEEVFTFSVCEEKLHVLCSGCAECPSCQRSICRACHRKKCPKCGEDFDRKED